VDWGRIALDGGGRKKERGTTYTNGKLDSKRSSEGGTRNFKKVCVVRGKRGKTTEEKGEGWAGKTRGNKTKRLGLRARV